jgi:hypothetical protein
MNVTDMKREFSSNVDQPLFSMAASTPPDSVLSNESKNTPKLTSHNTRRWNAPIGRRSSRAPALTQLVMTVESPHCGERRTSAP